MNCSKCGFQNEQDAKFCRQCGAAMDIQPPVMPASSPQDVQPSYYQSGQTPPPYYQAPYQPAQTPGYYPQQKPKKKTGLIIGLVAGGVLLIAAAVAAYLFFFSGTPVAGQWYCEERGWVLSFEGDDAIEMLSLEGSEKATYEYDKTKGQGSFTIKDKQYLFKTQDKQLILADQGTKLAFSKLEDPGSLEKYVLKALEGLWVSEEIGEVLRFEDGDLFVYSPSGGFKGSYKYDIDKAEGTILLDGKDYVYKATHDKLEVNLDGTFEPYLKGAADMDIPAFVQLYGVSVAGMWYEKTGNMGTISFGADGTVQAVVLDQIYPGTYTFDTASETGTITIDGESTPFALKNGQIEIEGVVYIRDYVAQLTAADASVSGTWYDTKGLYGTITLYDDGSVEAFEFGQMYYGSYTFNAVDSIGVLYITYGSDTAELTFTVSNGLLYLGEDYAYTRDYVEQVAHILGTWYDMKGEAGTLVFDDTGSFYMDTYGLYITGTYVFDTAKLKGTLTMQFDGEPFTVDVYMENGLLTFEETLYTRDYVAQPYYEEPVVG